MSRLRRSHPLRDLPELLDPGDLLVVNDIAMSETARLADYVSVIEPIRRSG